MLLGTAVAVNFQLLCYKRWKKASHRCFQSVARVGMDLPFFVKPRYRPKCPPHGGKDDKKGGVRSTLPCDKSFEKKMAVFFFFHHVHLACSSKRPVFFGLCTRLPCGTPQVEIPKFVNTLKYVNTLKVAVLGPRGKPPFLPSRNWTRVGNTTGGNTTGGTNQDNLNSSAGSFGTRPRVETPKLVNTPKECLHKA